MVKYKVNSIIIEGRPDSRIPFGVRVAIICTIMAIMIICYALWDVSRNQGSASKSMTSSFTSERIVQTSDYFTFETDKYWALDKEASTADTYYYRKNINKVMMGSLRIAINKKQSVAERSSPYVIAVSQNSDTLELTFEKTSPNCLELLPDKNVLIRQEVKYLNATFYCTPDPSLPVVVTSLIGGTDHMQLKRPGGATAFYDIRYDSASFNGSAEEVEPLLATFKVR